VRLLDLERVEQPLQIVGEQFQCVFAGRRARLAVATGVEAQHLEFLREHWHLRIPHVQVAGERMAHRQPRAFALDFVIDVDAVGLDLHGSSRIGQGANYKA
jgi:hypothetical protein